jgi:GntR family transcriptional regulator
MIFMIINPADELPIYRQIMRQITEAIAAGKLKVNDKLPSHRELSEQLVVAPLTVKKAYDELEALHFIETQRGRGTFVCAALPKLNLDSHIEKIKQTARQLVSQARLAGLSFSEISKIIEEAETELSKPPVQEKEQQ